MSKYYLRPEIDMLFYLMYRMPFGKLSHNTYCFTTLLYSAGCPVSVVCPYLLTCACYSVCSLPSLVGVYYFALFWLLFLVCVHLSQDCGDAHMAKDALRGRGHVKRVVAGEEFSDSAQNSAQKSNTFQRFGQ